MLYTVSDLFGDLVNGQEVFFIQDTVSKGIPKASQKDRKQINVNKNISYVFRPQSMFYKKWFVLI